MQNKSWFTHGKEAATHAMRQAVAYYRESTQRQEESGLGTAAQHSDVDDLQRTSGLFVVREYYETESAKKNNRPVLLKAIKYCIKTGMTLIIAKCDRLTRKALFGARILDSKLNLIAADRPTATKLDLLQEFIYAEREGITISKRTSAALQAAKRHGVKLGTACKELARKNKQAAETYARKMSPIIQDLRGHGFTTINALVTELNRLRIPPPSSIRAKRGGYALILDDHSEKWRRVEIVEKNKAKWHRTSVWTLEHRIDALNLSPQ
ncbi:recombinase family protein [Chitinophaga pendula]|uniref:recombinase family protein n=1 Tax=Chitinophaga TaxID=79328 RepID=UPI000BB01345|nr:MULTISPECIES: recombinase family protein [Chitinophaga]ASZ11178.1 resolvase [Chitinophaga sp. MD30]UCJ05825.1 recombinase family protein [Chitinophaga pendula]